MSRPIFFATRDQLVTDPYGAPVAGQQVRIYTAPTGGSQITDLLFVNPTTGALGAAVTAGYLVSDGNGFIPAFASVDGGRDVVYADCGPYGSRTALVADPSSVGGGGGSSTPPLSDVVTTSADGALVIGKHNAVDSTSGNRTMTLANAGSAGLEVAVEKTDATTNTVTVNVTNLRGTSGSFTLNFGAHESIALVSKADGSWWPYAGHKTKTALDSTYAPGGTAGNAAASDVTTLATTVATKAPLASPALTGNPTAPTAAAGDNDTSIATTAFVQTTAAGAAAGLAIALGGI